VRKLATADRMLNEGKDVADVCRKLQVSEQTYYRAEVVELVASLADDPLPVRHRGDAGPGAVKPENRLVLPVTALIEMEAEPIHGYVAGRDVHQAHLMKRRSGAGHFAAIMLILVLLQPPAAASALGRPRSRGRRCIRRLRALHLPGSPQWLDRGRCGYKRSGSDCRSPVSERTPSFLQKR
jgi:hypothetical protein